MDVKEIITAWLKENGFDGLFNSNGDCGCGIDDLCPCNTLCTNCEPAYKWKPPSHSEPCGGCSQSCDPYCQYTAFGEHSCCFRTVKQKGAAL